MHGMKAAVLTMAVVLAAYSSRLQGDSMTEQTAAPQAAAVPEQLERLVGRWAGTARTWFRPDELADTSEWRGEIRQVAGGHLLMEYEGAMQGKPLRGTMLLAVNPKTGECTAAWVDSFHSATEMMVSRGKLAEGVIQVLGSYKVEGHPEWGWRTELRPRAADEMTITMWNILPDGREAKAVEVEWKRAK